MSLLSINTFIYKHSVGRHCLPKYTHACTGVLLVQGRGVDQAPLALVAEVWRRLRLGVGHLLRQGPLLGGSPDIVFRLIEAELLGALGGAQLEEPARLRGLDL